MADITIRTNNVPRDVLYWHELTDKERAEFDYLETTEQQDEATFVRYRGWVYNVADFMCIDGMPDLKGWDGYRSDSFYSGVVIRLLRNDDRVILGTYMA